MNRKPLFDLLRRLMRRPFRQGEVDEIDAALDDVLTDRRSANTSLQVSTAGIALIKSFEGCARMRADGMVEAYPDPGTGGAPWTIGWGATGPGIGPETLWTREECDARLRTDLERFGSEVETALAGAVTSQAQFDALVSFHYNTGAIGRATLTRRHRAGDHAGAAAEFARWKYAGGRVLKGLVRRREAEAALYRSGSQPAG
ncbi:lysozyme [Qipengyuania spongiae]|uniref:Lysozyme n=1 Tax=Qipengyuania spongiae TaxID=2909673 RepID=A0ABY5T538_9SPHN|nr:lysozyme [Qipengyuania spongiae]UVI40458.1 lysozyme [Qipengyuania spongiae]